MPRTKARKGPPAPLWLLSDHDTILLAHTKGAALVEARRYAPLDPIRDVEFLGWMTDIGWDRENYERKRDFVAESGYTSWWESCLPPRDRLATKRCMPGWEVIYDDGYATASAPHGPSKGDR
jgi:hypothetical protein